MRIYLDESVSTKKEKKIIGKKCDINAKFFDGINYERLNETFETFLLSTHFVWWLFVGM